MGYRYSLYKVSKKYIKRIENIENEQFNINFEKIYNVLTETCIKYDTLSHVFDNCSSEDNLYERIFKNELDAESDMSFLKISKEQMKSIILYIQNHCIADWKLSQIIEFDNNKNAMAMGPYWTDKFCSETQDYKYTPELAMKELQKNFNHNARIWKSGRNIDLDLDNKWVVSNGTSWDYSIFDFIHIYKIFDWENDELIVIAG